MPTRAPIPLMIGPMHFQWYWNIICVLKPSQLLWPDIFIFVWHVFSLCHVSGDSHLQDPVPHYTCLVVKLHRGKGLYELLSIRQELIDVLLNAFSRAQAVSSFDSIARLWRSFRRPSLHGLGEYLAGPIDTSDRPFDDLIHAHASSSFSFTSEAFSRPIFCLTMPDEGAVHSIAFLPWLVCSYILLCTYCTIQWQFNSVSSNNNDRAGARSTRNRPLFWSIHSEIWTILCSISIRSRSTQLEQCSRVCIFRFHPIFWLEI